MAVNPFVDYVKIYFRSGNGGPGKVSFRREKHVPLGGPDGGDGGNGGSIVLVGDSQLWTLLDLKYRKHIHAPNGEPGGGAKKHGKTGKDEIVRVPLGTSVKDAETGDFIGEVKENGEELVLLKGGIGGRGNWNFRSATNQTPDYADTGISGREMAAILELKVLADVGLVGFPNAGKSTLLASITAAKPKIADYPFTTLVPNLGIVRYRDFQSFVMADIPGIIEGANEGRGLGIRFLRHIERNSVLLYMVPATSEDIRAEFETLLNEVALFNPELQHKQKMLAITKIDLLDEEGREALKKVVSGIPCLFISSVTGEGIAQLKDDLWELLHTEGAHKW